MGRLENAEVFRDTERMCRCSTLYFNLNVREMWDGFYTPHREAHDPLHNDDIIYTPAQDLQALHERRLRRILDVAAVNGTEAIVLGAFGCGAFRNDPKVVAAAAMTAIADYLHAFRLIEFAVYCRPGDTANYDAFAASGPFHP